MTNCPNCGAPLSGWQCEYCGAAFYDFSSLDISFDKPIFMRFKFEGKTLQTKVRLTNFNVNSSPDDVYFYADNNPICCMSRVRNEIDVSFEAMDNILVIMEGDT